MMRFLIKIGLSACCLGVPLQEIPAAASVQLDIRGGMPGASDTPASEKNAKLAAGSKKSALKMPDPAKAAKTAENNRTEKSSKTSAVVRALVASGSTLKRELVAGKNAAAAHLARLTAYWASEGDYYTERGLSATGIRLHGGHCAVDPTIIPYGSVVEIPGVGQFLAVDTGSAVVSRTAAREAGHTREERGALVIDLFFEHRSEGERFAANGAKFVSVSWWTPRETDRLAREARSLFAEEDWNKIYSKQL
jgi:3D (Asp-Asp-Asp) domain-containing protein